MIRNNPEHKKATLKKLIQSGKVALSVSLAGTVVTLTIFIHTNVIKRYDVDFTSDLGDGYGIQPTIVEMVEGKIEDAYKNIIVQSYNEYLEDASKQQDTSLPDQNIDLVYDKTKADSDTVNLSDSYRECILRSLNRDDDIENPDIKITVADLKKVSSLTGLSGIHIRSTSDISWLNYCENLYSIALYISEHSIENLKQIKNLSAEKIDIDADYFAGEFRVGLNEENFPFLKDNKNLKFLFVNANIFDLNTQLVTELSKNSDYSYLELYYYNGQSKKVDVEKLRDWPRVGLVMSMGKGTYDFAQLYTKEEVSQLMNSGIELEIYDSDGKLLNVSEFFEEVCGIHRQIDEIVESLNINDKMTDNEKLKKVLEYTLTMLSYSQTSANLQEELGYENDILGNQPKALVNDLMEYSYKDGYLYGALNENGKPVCGSYAAFMEILLDRVGVEAYFVGSDYHAYNLVNVDGEYYYVDATFLDQDIIDMDEITKNKNHLIIPAFAEPTYATNIMPEGVKLTEVDTEKRAQELIDNVKQEYLIKFNNQVYTVSFTALMSILAGLGLAISKKKLERIERKETLDSMSDVEKIAYLTDDFEWAKKEYEESNPLKKAFLKISGQANFGKMQEEIDELKGIKK